MTMPSLFSQFVPSISSISSDDLSWSAIERSIPLVAKFGEDTGATVGGAGGTGDIVADSSAFCVTQFSAIRTEGLGSGVGSTTGATGGGTTLGEVNVGTYEVEAWRSEVFGVASSAAGPGR